MQGARLNSTQESLTASTPASQDQHANNSMTADELVKGLDKLVALPEVYLGLNRLIDSPQASSSDIAKLITQDTDLAARLLKTVNSAFYARPAPIETIPRAVTVIGTTELRNLVLATSVCRTFKNVPGELVDMVSYWGESVFTGIVATALAVKCNVLHRDRLFVLGMLHDIGRLPIYLQLPEQARDILCIINGDYDLLCAAEQEILGFTHADVGYALTQSWHLPESIQTVVRYHHAPSQAPEYHLETSLIHIGSILATSDGRDESVEETFGRVDPFAWRITRLDQEDIGATLASIPVQAEEILKFVLPGSIRQGGRNR